jgi:hypothetical protein
MSRELEVDDRGSFFFFAKVVDELRELTLKLIVPEYQGE